MANMVEPDNDDVEVEVDCGACSGSGECPDCNGNEEECESCDASGDCNECDGTGTES